MAHKIIALLQIMKSKFTAELKRRQNIAAVFKFVYDPQLHKWAILFSLSIILAMFLTPRIHFKHLEYHLGSIADKNIKADRDFLVEKKSATDQKIIEAVNDIQSVYDYDSEAASQIQVNVANAFSLLKESGLDKNTPAPGNVRVAAGSRFAQAKRDFESTIGIILTNEEFGSIYNNRSSTLIPFYINKLLASVYDGRMITNVTFLQQEKDKGIVIRDIRDQSEKEVRDLQKVMHINDIENALLQKSSLIKDIDNKRLEKVILSLAVKLIQPNLTPNKNATEARKQEAINNVKPVYFKVQKNEMIVREGEKITGAVLDKLEAYFRMQEEKRLSGLFVFTGTFFTIAILIIILYYPAKKWLSHNADLLFLSMTVILQVLLVKAGIFVAEAIAEAFPLLPAETLVYPIPFAVGAMLVSILIDRNLALILSIFLSLIITFLFDGRISLFLFSFLGSVVASDSIVDCRKRTAFFKVGLVLGLINGATILFLKLLGDNFLSFDTLISMIMGFMGGVFSGILVAGLTPLFEALFHYTTDIQLLELANLNQPIFQRMIIETPGTYHHSIIVASMVEAAAEAIKANSLLAKVSAYYHDIGKMKKPHYFIENQQNGENRHDKLTPKMSSLVIISHVKDGCELANNVKLGAKITSIIREHHGTSLVSYFYEKAKKDKDLSIRSLPESDFRYPGPKPQTKEAALVLLSDVVEASSRTLSNPTPSRIRTLVRERMERVFMDGQLDECELTFRDLNKIAESFNIILNGIFHHRIDYPVSTAIHEISGARKSIDDSPDRKQAEKNKGRPAGVKTVGK